MPSNWVFDFRYWPKSAGAITLALSSTSEASTEEARTAMAHKWYVNHFKLGSFIVSFIKFKL
jgi:hypothetical protein